MWWYPVISPLFPLCHTYYRLVSPHDFDTVTGITKAQSSSKCQLYFKLHGMISCNYPPLFSTLCHAFYRLVFPYLGMVTGITKVHSKCQIYKQTISLCKITEEEYWLYFSATNSVIKEIDLVIKPVVHIPIYMSTNIPGWRN